MPIVNESTKTKLTKSCSWVAEQQKISNKLSQFDRQNKKGWARILKNVRHMKSKTFFGVN